MQQEFPITITADGNFSKSLKPLLAELELWLNFQALKADWYGNEACILAFNFTLVRSLDETLATSLQEAAYSAERAGSLNSWVVEPGYAYYFEQSRLTTTAFIAVDDLVKDGIGIEQAIKARLLAVANAVAADYDLLALT
ncbi:hypothetical protein MSG37_06710 [Shewanella sp. 1CM18E]|uniref:hypothetical protein n=1 Tax=Shewanella sp. 1CM18E TaxID=2929169 RepID=UPI0020C0A69C|nr:hypothetical protein [Shewanella sp. 1CM18E]MCK8044569.1 hypothetical protein [Shewanella sp. 1CM18E]